LNEIEVTVKQLLSILLAASLAIVAGCTTAPRAQTVAPDPAVLRVGVAPILPPMIFKEGDRYVGAEADLAEAMGRDLGRRVVFVEEKWENLIDALCSNRVDIIMSSMSITPARSYRIAFSAPYLNVGQLALTRSEESYAYVVNLAGKAENGVGVKPGTTADFMMQQDFPKVRRKYYRDGEAAAEALLRKKIDLYVSDAPMIWYLAALNQTKGLSVAPLVLSQEQLGWGVRRSDPELLDRANVFLKKIQASGELNRIMTRWMPGAR
jgi:ABC-type amino acid transport substrate-binding protein